MTIQEVAPPWEWPLSRDDKKRRVLQLYECELKLLDSQARCCTCTRGRGQATGVFCPHSAKVAKTGDHIEEEASTAYDTPAPDDPDGESPSADTPEKETTAETPEDEWNQDRMKEIMSIFMTSPTAYSCDAAHGDMDIDSKVEARRVLPGLDTSDMFVSPTEQLPEGLLRLLSQEEDILSQQSSPEKPAGGPLPGNFSAAIEEAASSPQQPIDDMAAWRNSINHLNQKKLDAKGRSLLQDLHSIWDELTADPACDCTTVRHGDGPILVTAPHSIAIVQEGQAHECELQTAEIAEALAGSLHGTTLRWSDSQHRSSEILWDLSRQSGQEGSLLDPRICDPNYLAEGEIPSNPWYQQMCAVRSEWKTNRSTLHIDVLGCEDPPSASSHLTVGLGAMLQRAESSEEPLMTVRRVKEFGEALQAQLRHVLVHLVPSKKHEGAELLRVIYSQDDDTTCAGFSGAWQPESGRKTLSQLAVGVAGECFSHSVQLTMSRDLRSTLMKDPQAVSGLSTALHAAWVKASQNEDYSRHTMMQLTDLAEAERRLLTIRRLLTLGSQAGDSQGSQDFPSEN